MGGKMKNGDVTAQKITQIPTRPEKLIQPPSTSPILAAIAFAEQARCTRRVAKAATACRVAEAVPPLGAEPSRQGGMKVRSVSHARFRR